MALLHFTDANFKKEVLDSDTAVLVDFWAAWCGPCKAIAPVIEELSREYDGKMKFGKVDVDENSRTASQYGIMSIPTLIFFKKGKIVEQVTGALSKAELKNRIQEHI
jgi:thioredoxin 1